MILKIQNAEAEAQKIRMEASELAKEKIRHAEAEGKLLCRDVEAEAIRINEEKLQLTREKANELLERSRREAEAQAKLLMKAGEPYVKDAVKMIIGGMMEQCQ
jgi:vacuolar-type H+-ATPase subunit H